MRTALMIPPRPNGLSVRRKPKLSRRTPTGRHHQGAIRTEHNVIHQIDVIQVNWFSVEVVDVPNVRAVVTADGKTVSLRAGRNVR